MNNPTNTNTNTSTGSMDKKSTSGQQPFPKKDPLQETGPSSSIDQPKSAQSDTAPVKDELKKQAMDDAGKSQR